MFTAQKLRQENIAEYQLYMWQVEDILRANNLDIENIRKNIINNYPCGEEQRRELDKWYSELIDMMHAEGIEKQGHLQISRNVLIQLADLHNMLLKSTKYPEYGAEFYKVLPIIVELRAKSGNIKPGELEACFNALYGILIMKLRHKPISVETQKAVAQISRFVSMLASYYHKDKATPLFDKEDYDNI